ncbi:hypothetical protein V6C53_11285 [Desulfocurvibacter africanus]|uniref:hypothetical protein n=1 Tax=Desulfocurvibacter africanus TaxID=873 RepID=UPI002FDB4BB1
MLAALQHHLTLCIRAAPWPSCFAVLFALSALLLPCLLKEYSYWMKLPAMLTSLGGSLLSVLDGRGRYSEYRRVLKLLRRYGFKRKIFHSMSRSRCQRDAALLAARQTGHLHSAKDFYRACGYRWFHLLPDDLVEEPRRYLSVGYLKGTFGTA